MFQAQSARKLTRDQKHARTEALRNAPRAKRSKDPAQMRQSIQELESLLASFGGDVEFDPNAPEESDEN